MSKSILCTAKDDLQAEAIVLRLQAHGILIDNISVMTTESGGSHDIGHVKTSKAPEGATTGAIAGGTTGGVLGLLAGVGTLAIPGVGPFIAAGPILATLSGIAAGGVTGGLIGGLIGLGIPEVEAKVYKERLDEGRFLIAVHVEGSDDEKKVKDVFKELEAADVTSTSEKSA